MYVYLLFHVSVVLFPLGCVALIGAVLFNYVKAMYEELYVGKGWIDSPTGTEPAYKQYYFRKAYPDYQLVLKQSYFKSFGMVERIFKKGSWFFKDGVIAFFLWPIGITYYLIVAAGVVAGILAYLGFGLLHLSIVLTCVALVSVAALSLWLLNPFSCSGEDQLRCPHANCHRPSGCRITNAPSAGRRDIKISRRGVTASGIVNASAARSCRRFFFSGATSSPVSARTRIAASL